jgi:UDP:flavonoid glycosyltransferase YjiC (YdhE family)
MKFPKLLIEGILMKKKILFISETVTMSHLIRPLKIASQLSQDHYEIHFAATHIPDFLKNELSHFKVHQIQHGVPEKTFLSAIAQGKHPYTESILKIYVEEDLKLLKAIKPDLVIGDMRLSLKVSAQLADTPYLNISNSTWDSSAILPSLVPELPVVKFFGVTLSQLVYSVIKEDVLSKLAKPFNQIAQSYGVPEYGSYYDVLTSGDYTAYVDLKSLVKCKAYKPNKINVGALLYSMNTSKAVSPVQQKKQKQRVVVSLGSSGPTSQLQGMVNTLAELDIELVVATSGKNITLPARQGIIAAPYLPLDQVLADTDLLIFNGGSGSGYLGLSHGVPLLCIPSNIDQHQFSQAISQKGAAGIIRSDKLSMKKLKSMVIEMLNNNKSKLAARAIAIEISEENPTKEIEKLITTILESKAFREKTSNFSSVDSVRESQIFE